jgi:hypothetical protein
VRCSPRGGGSGTLNMRNDYVAYNAFAGTERADSVTSCRLQKILMKRPFVPVEA